MKNGFVIINYNDYETTKKILTNIFDYKVLDEIVVVDNCSTDNSYKKLLEIKNKKLTILKNETNAGYASGLNLGSKYLIEKYGKCDIIFSNPDIIIHNEKDIKVLLKTLNSKKEYGLVAPVVEEREGLNRGWKIPTPIQDSILNVAFIHRFLRPKLLFYPNNYYTSETIVDAVSGCFFCMKSTCLEDVNFFDDKTFLYYEENIMAVKLKQKNYKSIIKKDISVFHNHAITIDKNIHSIKKYKILKESQLYFQKEYNKANILEIFLLFTTNKLTLCLLKIINFIKR